MKRGTETPSFAAAFCNIVQCTRHSRRTDCLLCHSTLKSFTCVLAHFIQLFYCGAEQWFLRTDNSFSMFNRKLFWLSKAAAKQEELEGQNLRFWSLSKTGRFLFVSLSYGCDFLAPEPPGHFWGLLKPPGGRWERTYKSEWNPKRKANSHVRCRCYACARPPPPI